MELTVKTVRLLKGAPLSVLLVMLLVKVPVTAEYICRHSGYRFEAVNEALKLLMDYGMVQRLGRYQWQICNGVMQLPLMFDLPDHVSEPEPSADDESNEADFVDAEIMPVDKPVDNLTEKQPELAGTSEKPKSDFGNSEVPSSRFFNQNPESRNPDSSLASSSADFGKTELPDVLDEFGIREPARGQILAMPGMTAAVVRHHCRTANSISLAIWRIKNGWPAPKERASPPGEIVDLISEPEPEPDANAAQAWEVLRGELMGRLSRPEFDTWIRPLVPVGIAADGKLEVRAMNHYGRDHARQLVGESVEVV